MYIAISYVAGCYRMVVLNYLFDECLSPLWLWDVLDTTLCDKILSVSYNRSVVISGYYGFLHE
jgi:hypothetical protein